MDTNNNKQGNLQSNNNQVPAASQNNTNQGNVGLEGLFDPDTKRNSSGSADSSILPEELKDLAQNGFSNAQNSELGNSGTPASNSSSVKKDTKDSSVKPLSLEYKSDISEADSRDDSNLGSGLVPQRQQAEGEDGHQSMGALRDPDAGGPDTEPSFEDLFGISDEDDSNNGLPQDTPSKDGESKGPSSSGAGIASIIAAFLSGIFWVIVFLVTALAFVVAYLYGYKRDFNVKYLKELTQQRVCKFCITENKLASVKTLTQEKEPNVSITSAEKRGVGEITAKEFSITCKDSKYWILTFDLLVQSNAPIVNLSINFEPALEIKELYVDSSKIEFTKKGEDYIFLLASDVTKRLRLVINVNNTHKYILRIKDDKGVKESFTLVGFPDCKAPSTVLMSPQKGEQEGSETVLPSSTASITPPQTGVASFVLFAVGITTVLAGAYFYLFGGLISLGKHKRE